MNLQFNIFSFQKVYSPKMLEFPPQDTIFSREEIFRNNFLNDLLISPKDLKESPNPGLFFLLGNFTSLILLKII